MMINHTKRCLTPRRLVIYITAVAISLIYLFNDNQVTETRHSSDYFQSISNIYEELHPLFFRNTKPIYNNTSARNDVQKNGNGGIEQEFGVVKSPATNQTPVRNIYYIKVHKTGSSTLQNVLLRYGFNNDLSFVIFNCMYGMAFPNVADQKYFMHDPLRKQFNIVAEHARFDPDVFKSYMDPDTVVIGQIRHPFKYLSSLFGFEYLDRRFNLQYDEQPLRKFLTKPNRYDSKATWDAGSKECPPLQKPSVTKNSMAYHFGYYNQKDESKESIKNFLQTLDKHVSLVLIVEKFDESLLLMKHMFNWTISDIIYLPIGSLSFHNRKVYTSDVVKNRDLIDLHRQWSPVDYVLYDYYFKKLSAILNQQNDEFWEELNHFKTMGPDLKKFCLTMCDIKSLYTTAKAAPAKELLSAKSYTFQKNRWHEDIVISHLDCVKTVLSTGEYQHAVAAKQLPHMCINKPSSSVPKFKHLYFDREFCHREDHLVYTFPWNFVRNRIFVNREMCVKYVNG